MKVLVLFVCTLFVWSAVVEERHVVAVSALTRSTRPHPPPHPWHLWIKCYWDAAALSFPCCLHLLWHHEGTLVSCKWNCMDHTARNTALWPFTGAVCHPRSGRLPPVFRAVPSSVLWETRRRRHSCFTGVPGDLSGGFRQSGWHLLRAFVLGCSPQPGLLFMRNRWKPLRLDREQG